MQRRSFLGFCAGFVLFVASCSGMSQAQEDAGAFILKLADKALTALTDENITNAQRADRFRDLLQEGMDIPTVASRVLGPYVRRATDDEMKEFISLLEENIVRKYAIMFKGYSGKSIELIDTKDLRGDAQQVTVAIQRTDGEPPVDVRWIVHKVDGHDKIIDIIVERVSMVTTQKEEFVSVIRRGGGKVEALLSELRERNAELAANVQD
ncbi:MAG: ABC transporter substrate-binding protein [Alphaproteobacteria bacterium]|nr:ABC transporter substrate-binding protein [Alphaproteobacteria bacterium]